MRAILKVIGLLVLVIVLGGGGFLLWARETIPDLYEPQSPHAAIAAQEFETAITKSRNELVTVRQTKFYPSMTVSVNQRGKHVWSESIGLSDLKGAVAATPQTLYPIGSVSKTLTAALVMKMADEGRIELDAPIHAYAPGLPDDYGAVTLRQLLSHQAGVRNYGVAFAPPFFTENGLNREFDTTKESLSLFIDDPVLFEPDASFQYSTFGYTLVAYVLEQASGKDFLTLMEEVVLAPLALNKTQPDQQNPRAARRSTDYMSALRKLGVIQSPKTNSSYKWAGGGYLSTPDELTQFGDALLSNALISESAFAAMTTPRLLPNGDMNPQQYGLGFRIGTMSYPRGSDRLTPIFHHGGTAAGSECALLLAPEFEMSVALCGNAFTGGSGSLIQLAANIARNFQDSNQAEG
ncbi:serine hydrolase [Hyphococcus flavus]|uniref:Serine hydrolase n=1 Tax=Hyphococcus flavus TaxID=1866326 RepID=A0AAE9ZF09_9PROT|nr:serine hydrolase domain-containing protein [Hyphococcus flavus]WDI31472.1 serine hydrolase [Hyphococcus flavus]